ncbi:MAG: bifunctional phosphopantothenoylcysteine decarboxylase/phosphopantothenate--cysteine ligase CoaBC [Alysiella sp.]|uniref:bifunctional phosphopantothenoylcysteine decarboxylase/phosphopantothenate--cysteine ligase CoaBC n=1 Tax=Alysiella sp. TaxID=1872483 RepID=UPI0026DB058B|nr:bifunctional phosphopantothenoylcysteine decarboxylase/phosphopantothenate--cysteine ligase CoaBC [Alysiella sp.]MDO4434442.1 bifunctional phosphopantothenoylcysteine decarboxylase/phosphopantothenate--cysteine ligase CoaBC [Alysiella sp.]
MSKHILLAVSGGIAAYKSCELVRLLKKQGHTITVALSQAASEFVGAQTFQALSGNPVLMEQGGHGNGMAHINATRAADIMLIAPATANTIAKIAHGIADNLITEMAAARTCPLVLAPAMNVAMWRNPANQRNIAQLQTDGIHIFMPHYGEQACGELGEGRMQEAADIAELLPEILSPKPLHGKKILLTAGATYEAIDPVRGITNISSGKMGTALARACRRAGAEVFLIYGKLQTALPIGLAYSEHTISARQMHAAVFKQLETHKIDAFIAVAAVADYHVKNSAAHKIKKDNSKQAPIIELAENPDILRDVAALPNAPFCVGFAAESENLLEFARQKHQKKGIPLLVANDVSVAMGNDVNQIILLDKEKETMLPESNKDQIADAIVARMNHLMLRNID